MSTTESKVAQLIREAHEFLVSGECRDVLKLVKELTENLQTFHRVVNPPEPVVENPNVAAWRSIIKEGLDQALIEIQNALGIRTPPSASTFIRRAVMKDGGIKAKLGIKFTTNHLYSRSIDPVKIIQRHINEQMAAAGLPKVAVITTSGSQMKFNARVYIEGDDDYSMWVRVGRN